MRKPVRHTLQGRLRLGARHSRLQPSQHPDVPAITALEPLITRLDLRRHAHGHPEFGVHNELCSCELRPRYPDYREIEAVDFDFLAGNLGIACEA